MFNSAWVRRAGLMLSVLFTVSMLAVGSAEARMGGSFGSRGMRTFHSAPVTRTAPNTVSPIQRSMTSPNTSGYTGGAAVPNAGSRSGFGNPGLWGLGGGLLGGMLGGLMFHGLFGSMMGYGFGGFGGGISTIIQLAILFLVVSWLFRMFRRRAGFGFNAPGGNYGGQPGYGYDGPGYGGGGPWTGGPAGGGSAPSARRSGPSDEIGITDTDLETFEQRLKQVQDAFSREDHAALRRYTTPEMVSYLSEELADNATKGLRNDVSDVKFLQGDLAEAWREGNRDYATVAIKWSAIDLMLNRDSGAVVNGDPEKPAEATELWTFTRENRGDWLLSAIQEATA
jgi:predicted lipid-binding transport protein (Tim44 family)